jgi:hypothetical protein
MRHTTIALAAVLGALTGAARLSAADPPLPAELKLVPADAAVFAHVDVDRVWKSKVGDTFRTVSARDIEEGLKKLKEISGLTPDDVKTFTFYIPRVKQDGEPPINLLVRTKKPLDRAGIVKAIKDSLGKNDSFEQLPGNKFLVEKRVLVDLGDPTLFRLHTQFQKDKKDEPAAGDGPIAPAIKAAAAGTPGVLGVAFGNLPDEIRQEQIPSEFRPFQPFFFTDAAILTAEFVKDDVVFTARFKAPTRARAVEAEKSLGALKTLIEGGLTFGAQQLEKDAAKDGSDKRLIAFVKTVHAAVKAGKITHEDNTPAATMALKADTDYAPFIEFVFGKVSGAAARSRDQNNLKQLGLAMHNYHDTYRGLPPAAIVGRKGKMLLSWRVAILPYVDQNNLYQKFKLNEPWDSPHNKKVLDENPMPPVFALPGVTKPGDKTTHYQVFAGNGALFDVIQGVKFAEVKDGLSYTAMVATAKKAVPWTKPDDLEFDPKKDPQEILLFVNGVCSVAFADGSVRSLSEKMKADLWKAIITKAGGEPVNPNDF